MKKPEKIHRAAAFFVLACHACAAGENPNAAPSTGQGAEEVESAVETVPQSQRDSTDESLHSNREAPPGSATPEPEPGSASEATLPAPENTKVLHVGDSFAGALGKPLGELLEAAGVRSVLKHTDSSYLTDWAWDGNLSKYLWKYNPDLVIVTLGANELEIVKPELREKTVSKIVSTIGERPCVWVAIPLWDGPKNGLLDVIKAHSAPCLYLDTNTLLDTTKMARISDGVHPTTDARKAWADDVFEWLKARRTPTSERPWNLEEAR